MLYVLKYLSILIWIFIYWILCSNPFLKKIIYMFEVHAFWNSNVSNCSNELGWRNNHNQSCRSWWVYNFVVNNFFIWNYLWSLNYVWSSHTWNSVFFLNCSNELEWRNNQNQTFRSWWDIQICNWRLFQLKSFMVLKFWLNFLYFKI